LRRVGGVLSLDYSTQLLVPNLERVAGAVFARSAKIVRAPKLRIVKKMYLKRAGRGLMSVELPEMAQENIFWE